MKHIKKKGHIDQSHIDLAIAIFAIADISITQNKTKIYHIKNCDLLKFLNLNNENSRSIE